MADRGLKELMIGPMAMENVPVAVSGFPLSWTVATKLDLLPGAAVGIPLMRPVVGLKVRPCGRDPETIVTLLYGGVPPTGIRDCE